MEYSYWTNFSSSKSKNYVPYQVGDCQVQQWYVRHDLVENVHEKIPVHALFREWWHQCVDNLDQSRAVAHHLRGLRNSSSPDLKENISNCQFWTWPTFEKSDIIFFVCSLDKFQTGWCLDSLSRIIISDKYILHAYAIIYIRFEIKILQKSSYWGY